MVGTEISHQTVQHQTLNPAADPHEIDHHQTIKKLDD
jgi:hypothetical protein